MKKRWMSAALALVLLLLTACTGQSQPAAPETITFMAMDTVIGLTARGEGQTAAIEETKALITGMEEELSRTREGSAIYALNHGSGQSVQVSPLVQTLLQQAKALYTLTGGRFDITIAPAADLWGFTQKAFHVPEESEQQAVRARVGIEHLRLDGSTVQLDAGSELDLGGIAKGYALEQAKDIFARHDLSGGIANLGGDILAYGSGSEGAPWRIGIRDPFLAGDESAYLGVLLSRDQYILTSGGYERYFEADGRHYQHIIDPVSCAPAQSDLESVTVVTGLDGGAGTAADALATALFVMGREGAIAFWRESTFPFEMILVDEAGHVDVTQGLRDSFLPQKTDQYQYSFLQ